MPVTRIEGYAWTVLQASRPGSVIGGQGRAAYLDGAFGSFVGDSILFIDVGEDAAAAAGRPAAENWMLLDQAMVEAASEAPWLPRPLLSLAGRRALAHYFSGALTVFDVDGGSPISSSARAVKRRESAARWAGRSRWTSWAA